MKVKDIETRAPEVIGPEASLVEAAQKMKNLDIGMLPVTEGDRLCGAITDRDIVVRSIAMGMNPNNAKVRDCMSKDVIYCFEEQKIKEVAELMEHKQIRRVPVLDNDNKLVGIISLGDLAVRTGKDKLAGEVLERVSEPLHRELAPA